MENYTTYETKNCSNQTYELITWMDQNVRMHTTKEGCYFTISRQECRSAAIRIFGNIKSLSTRISTAMHIYRQMNEMSKDKLRWC